MKEERDDERAKALLLFDAFDGGDGGWPKNKRRPKREGKANVFNSPAHRFVLTTPPPQKKKKHLSLSQNTEGKPIPTELRRDERALRNAVELEDDNTAVARTSVDDEYARAAFREPRVLVTTSRDPSSRLTQFAKELRLVFPNSARVNRGGQVVADLVESARSHDFSDIVVVHEHRGKPDGLVLCHLPHGPTAHFGIYNAVLRHDLGDKKQVGTVSEAYPRVILDNLTSKLGARIGTMLKHLFPPPKPDARRVVTFANRGDFVHFRHHTWTAPRGPASAELTEVGPRFELRLFQIKLGTMADAAADDEWALRAYVRSAKKAKLSETDGEVGGRIGGEGGDGDGMVLKGRERAPRKKRARAG